MTGNRIVVLTGPVGAGKTTVAERVVGLALRQGLTSGGILAPAMLNRCGQKVGIWGQDAQNAERRVLARADRDLGGPRIGPYSFDDAALAWALGVIEGAIGHCDLLVVDEIGRLELERGIGLAAILPGLASGQTDRALVLVRDSLVGLLADRLGTVDRVQFRVEQGSRGELPGQIVAELLQEEKSTDNQTEV
ncbi:nucleoside-triphosphatase [Chloroflexota bacterium]